MARKANPAAIGLFVVGAIALAIGALVVFGSGHFFKDNPRFVCFFSGNVDGLNVGAPVKFKGVEIGSVLDIRLRLAGRPEVDPAVAAKGIRIPVVIEIDQEKMVDSGGNLVRNAQDLGKQIERGLRAQLATQSLVTGLLFVQFDYLPEKPAEYLLVRGKSPYIEIPTVPTAFEQIQLALQAMVKRVDQLPLENMVRNTAGALESVDRMLSSAELRSTLEQLPSTVKNINDTTETIRVAARRLEQNSAPLFANLTLAAKGTTATLEQASAALRNAGAALEPDSILSTQMNDALQELTRTARSVRALSEYLERNPGSLVRGKEIDGQ